MTDLFEHAATLPSPPAPVAFDGVTYDPDQDHGRLRKQLNALHKIMSDGGWHTLRELADAIGCEPQSASARIRDLRKEQYGGLTVDKERLKGGLWRYRLKLTGGSKCAG